MDGPAAESVLTVFPPTNGKRCKSLISTRSTLLVFHILLIFSVFSPIESFHVHLLQNGFCSQNIGMDAFRCGVNGEGFLFYLIRLSCIYTVMLFSAAEFAIRLNLLQ